MFTIGAQPPSYKGAQTTWRGHDEMFRAIAKVVANRQHQQLDVSKEPSDDSSLSLQPVPADAKYSRDEVPSQTLKQIVIHKQNKCHCLSHYVSRWFVSQQ